MRVTRFLPLVLSLFVPLAAHAAVFTTGGPASTNNDDSCDIAVLPAATLLLPYFEVDVNAAPGSGETTLFTITNVSDAPQLAEVTLWTDYAYPAIAFDIFLTGYDVQSINLYDVIVRGRIAPEQGTGPAVSPRGEFSKEHNPILDDESCLHASLPVTLPSVYITRMKNAFTRGVVDALGSSPACNTVGGVHEHAAGYATIDVVGSCNFALPTDPEYFSREIRFENVLTGDYQQVNGAQNYAQGNPMVHIRAIPEGEHPLLRAGDPAYHSKFQRTFYSRYQNGGTADGRQPLPATFAARWIAGGPTSFATFYKIWREGTTAAGATCAEYTRNQAQFVETVRFDEEENAQTSSCYFCLDEFLPFTPTLRSASLTSTADESIYPPNPTSAVGGWMYLNLDTLQSPGAAAAQSWVIVSMRAEGRFSVDFDALALGNGCSPHVDVSESSADAGGPIGPAPNVHP
jgi:hypothetical protein